MRVLSSLNDPRSGGPQLRSLSVAKGLQERNVETEFLLPDGDDEFTRRARSGGFTVHRPGLTRVHPPKQAFGNVDYVLQSPLAVHRIRNLIRKRSIDIVHVDMSLNFDAAVGTWRSDAALVWHFNDVVVPFPLNRIAAMIGDRIAGKVVVASDGVSDHYFPRYDPELSKIYAPMDVQEFNPDAVEGCEIRGELGLAKETVDIGSIGSLNPVKGHEFLVRAAERVESHMDQPVAFLIAGSVLESRSGYYEKLKRIRTDLDLDDVVHFLGHRSDVANLLAEFDLFVLASTAEACSMAVLEAMAMRKPIVATEVGGVPELIDSGISGWLVPPKDPDSLAEAILEVLNDTKEGHRRARIARKKATENFSLEHCVDRHIGIYRKVL